jgi:hypothetical protein
MKKLESLLPEYIRAEPQSRYSSDIMISFNKNTDKTLILKKLKEYNIHVRELSIDKYILSPTDGESNDILRRYVWGYFKDK